MLYRKAFGAYLLFLTLDGTRSERLNLCCTASLEGQRRSLRSTSGHRLTILRALCRDWYLPYHVRYTVDSQLREEDAIHIPIHWLLARTARTHRPDHPQSNLNRRQ